LAASKSALVALLPLASSVSSMAISRSLSTFHSSPSAYGSPKVWGG